MITCIECKNKFNDFLDNKLSSGMERKFIYHVVECKECFDELLEEYIFYVSFNDLDTNVGFDYRNGLTKIINDKKNNIEYNDTKKRRLYIGYSLLIIILCLYISKIVITLYYK